MSSRTYKIVLLTVAAVLMFGVSRVQWILVGQREALGLNRYTELKGAPPVLALTTVALGGFRGLISNALWIRANQLQEDDKFFEMAQLADWITKLEPHFTQVWLMQGWNMAFNISVKFKDKEDRWRWVKRGIELLRDEGLRYNPYDPLIYRELAWFFQFKMGGLMDDAHMHYKRMWALEMQKVFGGRKPDWDELIHPTTDDAKKRAAMLRDEYKMNPEFMKQLDEKYGPLEWHLPEAHAIYWAAMALDEAKKNATRVDSDLLIQVRRIIYESMMFSYRHGRLVRVGNDSSDREVDLGPNLEIIPNVNKAFEQQEAEDPKDAEHMGIPHRNFLLEATYILYLHNRKTDAAKWFGYVAEKWPDKPMVEGKPESLPRNISLDDYVLQATQVEINSLPMDKTKALLEAWEENALYALAVGDDEGYISADSMAQKIWSLYNQKTASRTEPLALPPLIEIRTDVAQRMLNGGLEPDVADALRKKMGQTNTPAAKIPESK